MPEAAKAPSDPAAPGRGSRLPLFIQAPRLAVWRLALPAMAGLAVHSLYSVADRAFVGFLPSERPLAAVTRSIPVFFVLIALTAGLGAGITSGIARAIGSRDRWEASRLAATGILVALVLGLGYGAAGLLSGPGLAALLGSSGRTQELAWSYLATLFWAAPLFFLSGSMRCVLTGEGDARTPVRIMTWSILVNLVLDPLFIFDTPRLGELLESLFTIPAGSAFVARLPALGLGVRGAALATVAAQAFSFLLYLWIFFGRRRTFVRVRPVAAPPTRQALAEILKVGAPTAVAQLIMGISMALILIILEPFGDRITAGYGAAISVDMIVVIPIFGLSGGLLTVAGMFFGAGRLDLVGRAARHTFLWAVLLAFLLGLGAWGTSSVMLRLFCEHGEAIAAGREYLGWKVFIYPMMAYGVVAGRLLQGCGQGVPYLVINAVRLLLVCVPLAWLLVEWGYGPEGVWFSFFAGGAAALAIAFSWVRRLLAGGAARETTGKKGGAGRREPLGSPGDRPSSP